MNELIIAILESQGYRVNKPSSRHRYQQPHSSDPGLGWLLPLAIAVFVLCYLFG